MKTKGNRNFPGGYSKVGFNEGVCSACGAEPIGKGLRFLGSGCYSNTRNQDSNPEEDLVTKLEVEELERVVSGFEKIPPTPVKHFSCDEYTQEQLRAILDGGAP